MNKRKLFTVLILALLTVALATPLINLIPLVQATDNSVTVATTDLANSVTVNNQRKTFYAAGRYWVFYENSSGWHYVSSIDGITWIDTESSRYGLNVGMAPVQHGESFSLWFNGTHVFYTLAYDNTGLAYRMGIPNSDGTITWLTSQQTIFNSFGALYFKPSNVTSVAYGNLTIASQTATTSYNSITAHHPSGSGSYASAYSQTFVSTVGTYNITSVSFELGKYGSPTVNMTANIYANTTSDMPTGSALATSLPINASTFTTSGVVYNFTFPTPYTLQNNTWMAVDVEASADGTIDGVSNMVKVYYHNDIVPGALCHYGDGWYNTTNQDLYFAVNSPLNTYVMNETSLDSDDWTTQIDTSATSGYYFVNPFSTVSSSNAALPTDVLNQGWITDVPYTIPDDMYGLRTSLKGIGTAHSGDLYWKFWYSPFQNMTNALNITDWDHHAVSFSGDGDIQEIAYSNAPAGFSNQTITNSYVYLELTWYDNGDGDGTSGLYIDDAGTPAGQNGFAQVGDVNLISPYISVDSSGYPWIVCETEMICGSMTCQWETNPLVFKSSSNNGTWINASGFPFTTKILGVNDVTYPSIIPLTNNKMELLTYNSVLYGLHYDGTNWGSLANLSVVLSTDYAYSAMAQGDIVNIVYTGHVASSYMLNYTSISPTSGFSEPITLDSSNVDSESSPTLTINSLTNDMYLFWITGNTIWKNTYLAISSSWSGSKVFIVSGGTLTNGAYIESCYNVLFPSEPNIIFSEGTSSPYSIRFALLSSLTLTILSGTGGTTDLLPGIYSNYTLFSTITVTAIPNSEYVFSYWNVVFPTGSGTNTTNPLTFTLSGNTTVQPVFSYNVWQLSDIYFHPSTQTVNNVSGYVADFTEGNSATSGSFWQTYDGINATVEYCVSAWVVNPKGTASLIVDHSGTITIITPTDSMETGAISNVPSISLIVGMDSLKFCLYIRFNGGSWLPCAYFVTERLYEKAINAGNWTLNLYVQVNYADAQTFAFAYWGSSVTCSGIGGVTFTVPLPQEIAIAKGANGDWLGMILYPYIFVIGNLFYGLMLLFAAGVLCLKLRKWEPVLILIMLFGGGGLLGALIPETAYRVFYGLILIMVALVIYRIFR